MVVTDFGGCIGMSNLELEALTNVARKMLDKDWQIKPHRIYAHCFETSLNAPGWSISLLNVSGIERDTKTPVSTILQLLDSENDAPGWPKNGYLPISDETSKQETQKTTDSSSDPARRGPKVDAVLFESSLRKACNAAIQREADITKWDIIMGDGDCGEAVVGMCQVSESPTENRMLRLTGHQGVLKKLDNKNLLEQGFLFPILDEISEAIEAIGGTLGAIISILFASFTAQLRKAFAEDPDNFTFTAKTAGSASGAALRNLMGYTPARKGGRTVMDTVIPFCEILESEGDFAKAVEAAEQGAQTTSGMKAEFGRATYVGESAQSQDSPPDPGAMAAAFFLRGLLEGAK